MIEDSVGTLWVQLKELISQNYPVSFITLILASAGFIMATIAARGTIAKLENLAKDLFAELIRRVK